MSSTSTGMPASLVAELVRLVGRDQVLDDPELVTAHTVDWTGRYRGWTPCVVRPRHTDEVAAVLAWCDAHGVAVVPQGGNTGLVGGSVPLEGEVVLSARRLQRLDGVDPLSAQVTVGAGVVLEALQRHVRDGALDFGVDLGARGSCTIGGMIATNAGGNRVLRHGPMRAQVLGVEAVLPSGAVLSHLGGLLKDNTGYDLAGLLCGSEGTLAFVTAARLRLVPARPERATALVALDSVEAAVGLAATLRREVPDLDALEALIGPALALVCEQFALAPPFTPLPAVCLLVECAGRAGADVVSELAAVLDGFDTVVATDPAGIARLWRYREELALAIAARGVPHKLDVTLPAGALAAFAVEVDALVASHGAQAYLFGHLGDGNIHVNVLGPAPEDETVDRAVLELAAEMGGSISAEHGIGTAKKPLVHLNRTEAELRAFAAVKRALDPNGIMNPNVLLP